MQEKNNSSAPQETSAEDSGVRDLSPQQKTGARLELRRWLAACGAIALLRGALLTEDVTTAARLHAVLADLQADGAHKVVCAEDVTGEGHCLYCECPALPSARLAFSTQSFSETRKRIKMIDSQSSYVRSRQIKVAPDDGRE